MEIQENFTKSSKSRKRTENRSNLEVYVNRLDLMFEARISAASITRRKIEKLLKQFVLIENELYLKSANLRSELNRYSGFKNKKLKLRVVPGAKNRYRIVGPQLEIVSGTGRRKVDAPLKANDSLAIVKGCVQKEDVPYFKQRLLEVGQLGKLYHSLANKLKFVVLRLDIGEWDKVADRSRGYDGFCLRRENQFFAEIMRRFDSLTAEMTDLAEKTQDANFEFNSIGGNKKGYKGLSRSFSTPLKDDIEPGYYAQHQVITKYTAFNMNGKKYTRSINQLDSSSNHSIRVTNRILKELGQERFKKPIFKWQDENLDIFDEYYEVLQRLSLIEEKIKDV